MTQAMKNKIWIFIWLLTLGLSAYVLVDRPIHFWEKVLMFSLITFTAILNMLSRIRTDNDFKICDETILVKKTFSKEKKYNIENILGWSETHYFLFDFRTNSVITIKTENGEKIYLYRKGAKDFERVSDYLNDNFSAQYENYR